MVFNINKINNSNKCYFGLPNYKSYNVIFLLHFTFHSSSLDYVHDFYYLSF